MERPCINRCRMWCCLIRAHLNRDITACPLSLMQLGATLTGRAAWEIIDGNLIPSKDPVERIIQRCRETAARYLGITIMPGPQLQQAVLALNQLRSALPGICIVVGGYFPSLHSEICARHSAVDYVIAGEGVQSLPLLLEALEHRQRSRGTARPGLLPRQPVHLKPAGAAE